MKIKTLLFYLLIFACSQGIGQRTITNFNKDWKFFLGNDSAAIRYNFNDTKWRTLNLPHDWSIEGKFSKEYPTTYNEGALPAGIGWYRKTFTVPLTERDKRIYINFDGVYRNSEVWINGHYLGKRPNGYISFRYELTPYLKFGKEKNVIAVKVDNSGQPNSRWYTGSGIYRKVWLLTTNRIAIDEWGTYVTTSVSKNKGALVNITTHIKSELKRKSDILLVTKIYDAKGNIVASKATNKLEIDSQELPVSQKLSISNPILWSVDNPVMYKAVSKIFQNGKVIDTYETPFGIRTFYFDAAKGFFLNGKHLKILGVCDHENLGALGAAVNKRAIERQLEILKAMGCNAIRTAHNPPSVDLLDLCDKMGFIVMDEAFDMWMKAKNKKDYHLDFAKWHKQDLQDMIRRDRNHPSIFIWSIGNEIREQFDSSGISLTKELVSIVKALDTTRPVTCALTENNPEKNFIYQSGALDLLGFNYKIKDYPDL
ncbi:MAG: sugar-binding domain-containing protein, partial [Ginsengibacter sp.]